MKKIFAFALLCCLSMVCVMSAMAQFRAEVGYMHQNVSDEDTDNLFENNGIKLGAYYMLNEFVEGGLTFASSSGKTDGVKVKHIELAIPINFGYNLPLNDDLMLRPYCGANFKFNSKFDAITNGLTIDMLDEDFMEEGVNRVQIGGQIGAMAIYKNFTLSYQFQGDFYDLYKESECKFRTNAISVGYIF